MTDPLLTRMRAENAELEQAATRELQAGAAPGAAVTAVDRTTGGRFTRVRVLLAVSKVYRSHRPWEVTASRAELLELLDLEAEAVAACGLRAYPVSATVEAIDHDTTAVNFTARMSFALGRAPTAPAAERLDALTRFAESVGADDDQLEHELAAIVADRRRAGQLVTMAIDQGLGPVATLAFVRERAAATTPIADRIIVAVTLDVFRAQIGRLTGASRAEMAMIDELLASSLGDDVEISDDAATLRLILATATATAN